MILQEVFSIVQIPTDKINFAPKIIQRRESNDFWVVSHPGSRDISQIRRLCDCTIVSQPSSFRNISSIAPSEDSDGKSILRGKCGFDELNRKFWAHFDGGTLWQIYAGDWTAQAVTNAVSLGFKFTMIFTKSYFSHGAPAF